MSIDGTTITIRNILALTLFTVVIINDHSPLVQQELLKIWKTLNTPLLPKQPSRTNHKSNSFWEIDMTDFEP